MRPRAKKLERNTTGRFWTRPAEGNRLDVLHEAPGERRREVATLDLHPPSRVKAASWAASAGALVLLLRRRGALDVVRVDPGGALRPLHRLPTADTHVFEVVISPDALHLAVTQRVSNEATELLIFRLPSGPGEEASLVARQELGDQEPDALGWISSTAVRWTSDAALQAAELRAGGGSPYDTVSPDDWDGFDLVAGELVFEPPAPAPASAEAARAGENAPIEPLWRAKVGAGLGLFLCGDRVVYSVGTHLECRDVQSGRRHWRREGVLRDLKLWRALDGVVLAVRGTHFERMEVFAVSLEDGALHPVPVTRVPRACDADGRWVDDSGRRHDPATGEVLDDAPLAAGRFLDGRWFGAPHDLKRGDSHQIACWVSQAGRELWRRALSHPTSKRSSKRDDSSWSIFFLASFLGVVVLREWTPRQEVFAVSVADGRELWRSGPLEWDPEGPPLITPQAVFGKDGAAFCTQTGALLWRPEKKSEFFRRQYSPLLPDGDLVWSAEVGVNRSKECRIVARVQRTGRIVAEHRAILPERGEAFVLAVGGGVLLASLGRYLQAFRVLEGDGAADAPELRAAALS